MRLVRLVSVTAVATATCALWALPASAATAASQARHPTSTRVSVSPSPAWVGQRVRLSATVRSSGRTPTGTVAFLSFGRTMCVAHLSHGAGTCFSSFGAVNTYIVRGFYSGDRTHRGSVGATTVTVRRSPTTTKITKITPDPLLDGMTAIITVRVTAPVGTPVPTGTVAVAPTNVVGSTAGYTCLARLVNGTGSCPVTPPKPSFGLVDFVARYSGNGAHTRSVSGTTVLPVQETTKTTVGPATATAGSVTLTADVVSAGDADISPNNGGSGSVTFYNGNTPITGCVGLALSDPTKGPNNTATCTVMLTANTYTINAVYSGDDVNLTSTGTVTLVVSP